jgi:hypothetical protein
VPKRLTVEDILSDELKRDMNLDTETHVVLDDWDSVMHSVHQMPIEYAGYTNKVGDMKILKEIIDSLAGSDFDQVKRSESRKKQLGQFTKTLSMYYNLVFTKGENKVGFGALMHFPKLKSDPDRSGGLSSQPRFPCRGKNALRPSNVDGSTTSLSRYSRSSISPVTSTDRRERCSSR